jgi:hypothetical protein
VPVKPAHISWPEAQGEVAGLLRASHWLERLPGPPAQWPQGLRMVIDMMLPAATQMILFWGPQYLAFYNDAYAPTLGDRHPHALGQPAAQHWSSLWPELVPLLASVRATGKSVSWKDRLFQLQRGGCSEAIYFDITHSAVRDEAGAVAGVLCIFSETTQRVRAALRETNDQLKMAEAASGVGFFLVDIASGKATLSAEFCKRNLCRLLKLNGFVNPKIQRP